MAYLAPIPALPPLESGQYESPVPAIEVGEVHHNAHLIAAKEQLMKREVMARLYPQLITDAELVAAERRHHRIKTAQFDTPGPDGHSVPGWVPMILQRMDAQEQRMEQWWKRMEQRWKRMEQRWRRMERQWQRHENRIEQRLETMSREIRRESQRAMNRSIRTNAEALEPVLRTEDGQVPDNFPATMGDFRSARGPQIDALLRFYNLARAKGLAERKASLQRHLGLNL